MINNDRSKQEDREINIEGHNYWLLHKDPVAYIGLLRPKSELNTNVQKSYSENSILAAHLILSVKAFCSS